MRRPSQLQDFVGLIFGVFNYGDSGLLKQQTPELCGVVQLRDVGKDEQHFCLLMSGSVHHELIAFRTQDEGGQLKQSGSAKNARMRP